MKLKERNNMHEKVFIVKGTNAEDIDLFLGDGFDPIWFEPHETMAHIMFRAGVFDSVTLARKNGWNKHIADGFTMFRAKNKTMTICILSKLPERQGDTDVN